MIKKIVKLLAGDAKNPLDSEIFHQMTLIAFLAWVGLGADGLSSSAYGPEEAYRALGQQYHHLALYLAIATSLTVFIISASYNQIIEFFPSGGGGYVVASKLLGQGPGLVSGSALVVDYMLTISISVAAGVEALFSIPHWESHKLITEMIILWLMIGMNLRGIKESITTLLPIFLVFVATHLLLIGLGIFVHLANLPMILTATATETSDIVGNKGIFAMLGLLLTAYSMGGGTYTGIEAVSNGLGILREPRVQTGKRTMLYMACSLAFTAGGILLLYMLWDTQVSAGQTMNAVLIDQIFGSWNIGGIAVGKGIAVITLASEGALLFIAAQAGFVDGPNVLATMAVDSWIPHRFANLSNRLVRKNGILVMGIAAWGILYVTQGKIDELVVLYSINVFVTFSLSQLSMCKHWLQVRHQQGDWWSRLAVNGLGLILTVTILISTTIIKFRQGGWLTMLITGGFIVLCIYIRKHYGDTRLALKRLDEMLVDLSIPSTETTVLVPDPAGPTAVLLVNAYSGLGIHAIFSMRKLFKQQNFKNLIFVSVGRIDSAKFKGIEEIENLRAKVEQDLKRYVDLAQRMGYAADFRMSLGIDVPTEIAKLCDEVALKYSDPIYFSAKLIFARENLMNRFLHNQTSMEIQRRLLFQGQQMIVLPIRVL
jgi:amino acid transporter